MKRTKKGNRWERKIGEIFGYSVESYIEKSKTGEISFSISNYDLNYDRLCKVSKLLNTTKIFINGGFSYGYYDAVEVFLGISCQEVKF